MTSPATAPVALFVFNRPGPTAQVFERVRAARPRCLLVVADGPRPGRPDDAALCRATRAIVSSPDWPCELSTNFADENLGCRRRVSSGLDWVFTQCAEAIVLEDDCVPCPSFFSFSTLMLSRYRDDSRVMHVSGDNFHGGERRGPGSYFFSRYSLSWGWATWRRAWRHYDVGLAAWPAAFRERWLESVLDDPAEIALWEEVFDRVYRGRIDTWDYQWLFACWRRSGLSILPNENLVTNIGLGPDATHFTERHRTLGLPTGELAELTHPSEVARDEAEDRRIFEEDIAGSPSSEAGPLLRRLQRRLVLRTRVKRLVPRALRYR